MHKTNVDPIQEALENQERERGLLKCAAVDVKELHSVSSSRARNKYSIRDLCFRSVRADSA